MGNQNIRDEVNKILSSSTDTTVTVLSSLLLVQDEIGYIPNEAVEEIGSFLKTSINEVWGVATFYTNFRFTPPCANVLEVCWGPTCHLKGAPDLISGVLKQLNLEEEGDSQDKGISVRYNTCLGACQQAPVISVNHALRGNVKASEISNIIDFVADSNS
ncbi:MAG: NAD(P)H-dependent oxidoreductase subunit E [SAR202 cluster bacterium]|nr:NAD(P)H-dependent oxidoreductase subunit E [SAR202 cluster bacterium]